MLYLVCFFYCDITFGSELLPDYLLGMAASFLSCLHNVIVREAG